MLWRPRFFQSDFTLILLLPATRRCEKRLSGTKWRVSGVICEVVCLRSLTWTATVELHAVDACCAAE